MVHCKLCFFYIPLWRRDLIALRRSTTTSDALLAANLKDAALYPVEFFKNRLVYSYLTDLYNSIRGIDCIHIGCEDEDQVVSIQVQTSNREAFEECKRGLEYICDKLQFDSFNTHLSLNRSSSSVAQPFYLSVPCGAKKALIDDEYLKKLFEDFEFVDSLEYDEESRSLEIVASPEVTEMIVSKVLGRLSFNKRLPGVRKYRVFLNYLYKDIKVCPETGIA